MNRTLLEARVRNLEAQLLQLLALADGTDHVPPDVNAHAFRLGRLQQAVKMACIMTGVKLP